MSAVDKVLDTAKGWVGYLEKRNNDTRYLWDKTANAGSNNYTCFAYELADTDLFNGNKNGYPWCTSFVVYCFWKNFGSEKTHKGLYLPANSMAAGCVYAVDYYKAKGKFGSTPQLGAQIFFNDSYGEACHTGIVYGWDSDTVWTIEGNTSGASGVIDNGGGVCKKSYSRSYSRIAGYGYPDWDVFEVHEYTEGWVKDTNGWWYRYKDGSYPANCWKKINDVWYYFDSEGYALASQWKYDNGDAYYLDADCKMVTNRTLKIDSDGRLVPAGRFYRTMGDVTYSVYKEALEAAIKAGYLKGESGSGDSRVINLPEEAVKLFVVMHRAGVF